VNYGKLLEIDLFFFGITFGELPNSKVWETKNLKLLELIYIIVIATTTIVSLPKIKYVSYYANGNMTNSEAWFGCPL
jgi:hypothetical protein